MKWNRTKSSFTCLSGFFASLLVCCSLCLSFISSPASASTWGYYAPKMFSFTQNCLGTNTNGSAIFNANSDLAVYESPSTSGACSLTNLSFGGGDLANLMPIVNESYFNIQFSLFITHQADNAMGIFPTFIPAFTGVGSHAAGEIAFANSVIDTDVVTLRPDNNKYIQYDITIHGTLGLPSGSKPDTIAFMGRWLTNTSGYPFRLVMTRPMINIYGNYDAMMNDNLTLINSNSSQILNLLRQGITANVDTSAMVNEQKNTTNAINQQSQQQHSDALAQKQATEEQTQQQKEQYDQEKAEEKQREDEANEDADKVASAFNFNFLNPFAPIFELFNPGGCVSIPIISSWLHSEDKTYCPWFSESVRSVLTPVFSISAVMVIFGFVIRWLGGSEVIRFEDK